VNEMKRKPQGKIEPVIPAELLEQAKRSVSADLLKKPTRCSVCGADASGADEEPLCWVCRRLKISAWKDIEQQMPAQE
jgi:predicted amidophosphoribosyltransferase